jgi:hypothetical protein
MNAFDIAEINADCMRLFSGLCERKSLLPLVYLLHAWPIPELTDSAVSRLREALRTVSAFTDDYLEASNRDACKQLLVKLAIYECRIVVATC